MPGNPQLLHLATVTDSFREFIAMVCVKGPETGNCYIEEAVLTTVDYSTDVFANLKFIQDDHLAEDLYDFLNNKGLLDITRRLNEVIAQGNISWLLDD